ncbi:Endoribonuclease ysh1; AltName: Full=mRNA 3'-end-processing protein ysh1 [Cyberlindnera jadinii]|uniref:Endoribonuclease YSH1 n=1 Tax=Cyberlindnera jadinii (strain ATCC 18201 / CBS 1600 / BCRC 20928 / JCM 3617 / NBRC 0987 / NRRL Y-1542) TaxID=983966 RepID=A0A0H5C291_CYBJN|nr:Metallo-hydrolase/oxidoreductase [Cyberlindnera jadinii NRRL Y-1542]ODV72079.1 Metallo-hydrolase/oxidoreductase [Cyberlindnera jadinii NRRL Y-1542]CEP21866.1 Endoribonuclease ysh1; AltName: Full=mRNA 3'-end-processing protein ysh1 [Cyberlindnera jadinii]
MDNKIDDTDSFKFIALGGGSEVGRSCHIIQYKGKTIMLDAGVHPAFSGIAALPFYDEFDLATVDILLISHFHLDHAASLPYVMQHTNFKGRVFMTHPTKAIYRWLLTDFVKVTSIGSTNTLYSDEDLLESFDKIETVDYHSTIEVDGIRFTAFHAGHVLGAAMYMIEISGLKILFTGDYSREESRHLNVAEVPPTKPDILITESTFGTATHQPRLEKELRLTNLIHSTLVKGGNVLLPVFALGTAQELLLILDEYWSNHQDLENVRVYFASSLAKKCLTVFQTYVNMMNDNIRKAFRDENTNPFLFKHVKNIKNLDRFEDFGPTVVVASPGMLQNGVSRELLEKWAPDSRNSVILTGYSVEGTLAKTLITEPDMIPSINNPEQMIPRRINIEEISFAAHVDYEQNSKFIELVDPKSIILVHGESNPMGRLKSALLSKYSKFKGTDKEVKVYNPRNCDELSLKFKGLTIAKAMGSIVEDKDKQVLTGVLIAKDFDLNLMKVDDVREYAGLTSTVVKERQTIRVDAGRDLIQWHLTQMFGYVEVLIDEKDEYEVKVMNEVTVNFDNSICTIEWVSGVINDTIADSVVAILMSVDSSPASVKMSSQSCQHSDNAPVLADASLTTRVKRINLILEAQFGDAFTPNENQSGATIKIGKSEAQVDYVNLTVTCSSNVLKGRIENALNRATELVAPLAQRKGLKV